MPSQYFVNGKIFTGKNERDFVSAMKVTDGKIEWIGPSEQADAPDPVDLQGKTVVPGFIDAHAHPRLLADIAGQAAITIPEVTNIEEAIAALKKQAEKTPDGGWIEGWGWDETKLLDGRPLNRFDLDRVSTERPVHVMRSDFHSSAVNSK
ncbi:amidohydrolase family protein, partial [Caldibacillus debilis]